MARRSLAAAMRLVRGGAEKLIASHRLTNDAAGRVLPRPAHRSDHGWVGTIRPRSFGLATRLPAAY
jgi:hypothetical protein